MKPILFADKTAGNSASARVLCYLECLLLETDNYHISRSHQLDLLMVDPSDIMYDPVDITFATVQKI